MKKKAMHYRHAAGVGICGKRLLDGYVTRNKRKVTCGNCLRVMRRRGHFEEDVLHIKTERAEYELKSLLRKQRISELEAEVANLKAEAEASETMAEKWRIHAEHIQNLAAEGKDPLTGEEPEFWLVWDVRNNAKYAWAYSQKDARLAAEEAAISSTGNRFFVLPAFDYAICEVSPVAWKRKSAEKADDEQEFPF